ncbi:SUN domain-containing protein 1-like [Macadamia integrifolia]|uniref:SUN domain-containing protein 1-like n=1 Tax=Macadamia integrifolia TaxID=60698 RepID=UPI001C4FE05C|nr:SUN domain-containing protein 1-like [Macadamia integrifolia]XP_042514723.1 SUN domain-containing protein 1-like [Macadamia integrifolia]
MSASTVAINANPAVDGSPSLAMGSKPTARRRSVVVAEKKSSVQMVGDGVSDAVGDEKLPGGKDFSHSIRGEAVLERPKDLLQEKKNLINSTISPRRTKKVVPKPEKHWWQRGFSTLIWNLLSLLIVLVLAQLMWKAYKSEDSAVGRLGMSDFEGRIAEVEKFVKTTSKMIQVQVEVVDRKLTKVEEKGASLENEMKKLVDRTDGIDGSLGELMTAGIITKVDFERFSEELKKSRSPEASDKDWTLDDIRALARDIVSSEIEKHASDGLGRVDYALASGGGMVVRHSEPYFPGNGRSWLSATTGRIGVHSDAQKMLQPSFGEPGQCFPLSGSSGWVEIRLRAAIVPEAITLEHVAKIVAYDRSSAPKDCRVSAWLQKHDSDPSVQPEMFLLTEFTYDLEKSNAQTIDVDSTSSGSINMIRFDYISNHGSPSHTCIYRLRVHGYEPESVAVLATQS